MVGIRSTGAGKAYASIVAAILWCMAPLPGASAQDTQEPGGNTVKPEPKKGGVVISGSVDIRVKADHNVVGIAIGDDSRAVAVQGAIGDPKKPCAPTATDIIDRKDCTSPGIITVPQ